MTRPVDHLVIAARSLDAVTAAYRRLGFLVGGRNRHSWGTENHIVQLHGSFLELIGLGADFEPLGASEPAAPFANTLADYIAQRDGLAQVALRSDDTKADADGFAQAGFSAGGSLHFGRTAEAADGRRREVAFTIAFAKDPADPAHDFFVCQHHRPENFWNPAMQDHPNTARRLTGVVMAADKPRERTDFLTHLFGAGAVTADADGLRIATGEQTLEIMPPARIRALYGDAVVDRGGAAFRIGVESMEAVQRFINVMGSPYTMRDGRLTVAPAIAGGAALSFEPLD